MTRQYIAFGLSLTVHLLAFALVRDMAVPEARNTAEAASSRISLPELAALPPELRGQEMIFQVVEPPPKPNPVAAPPNTNLISTVNSAAGDHWTGNVPENDTPHLEGKSKSYSIIEAPPPPIPGLAGLPKGVPAPPGLPSEGSARSGETKTDAKKAEHKQNEPRTEQAQPEDAIKLTESPLKELKEKKQSPSKDKEPQKEVPKGITLAQLDSAAAKASSLPPSKSKTIAEGKAAESIPLSQGTVPSVPIPSGVPNPGSGGADDSLAPATLHESFGGNAPERENISFGTRQHEWAPYLLKLKEKIGNQWIPLIRMRYTGTWHTVTVVEFSVLPDGRITDLNAPEGDDTMFRILCVKAVRDAGPFDPFPTDLPSYVKENKLDIRFTFEFK